MKLFWKIFLGFWAVWILWYLTGGPLRDTKYPTVELRYNNKVNQNLRY